MRELKDILKKINIILENPKKEDIKNQSIISQESLIKILWNFLCIDSDKQIIFNPGSAFSCVNQNKINDVYYFGEDLYLSILIVFYSLKSIYLSAGQTDNFIETLQEGTPVIYTDDPKDRYIFKRISEKNGFVGIELESTIESGGRFVPKQFWSHIIRDNGETKKRTRGRNGLRDFKQLNNFLIYGLKFKETELSSETNYSTIFVIDDKAKQRVRTIIHNVYLQYYGADGIIERLPLSDLTNAAFYSVPNSPIYFSSNVNKQEPIIKITSNLNTALELCSKKYRENEVLRIISFDSIIAKSKIAGILNLLSNNQKFTVETDYSFISRLNDVLELENYSNRKIKSYIPDGAILQPENIEIKRHSPITEVFKWQSEDILNKQLEILFFNTDFNEKDYSELKSLLFGIKRADVLSENKDLFFMKAYFILKTLSASVLSVEDIKDFIDLDNAFLELKNIQLPNYRDLEDNKKKCEDLLFKLLESRRFDNERKGHLVKLLTDENRKGKDNCSKRTVLIVVHKKYLQLSIESYLEKLKYKNLSISVETYGKIKNKNYYDLIICCGLITNEVFNVFDINFTEKVILLCAKYKEAEFLSLKKKSNHNKKQWFKSSFFNLKIKENIEDEKTIIIKEDQQNFSDSDFEELIKGIISSSNYAAYNSSRKQELTVNTLIMFDDDSCGFFTPMYKVNVLKQIESSPDYEVIAIPIEKVSEGDDIIFVERHGKMQDAIKTIQTYLVEKNALPDYELKAIEITQKWRLDLYDYVKNKDKHETKKSIAERCNISVIEFNNWLNFDFYIVGPDPKSISAVGTVIKNEMMINNPAEFKIQIDIVNRLHTKIRRALGEAIIAKEEGKTPIGEYAQKIFEEIGNLENIRRAQEIKRISKKVDISIINHPISY